MPAATSTRDRLLDTAERLFAAEGVDRASLRRITAEAGWRRGAPKGTVDIPFSARLITDSHGFHVVKWDGGYMPAGNLGVKIKSAFIEGQNYQGFKTKDGAINVFFVIEKASDKKFFDQQFLTACPKS